MSTTVICKEFAAATVERDAGSTSGKSIVWPRTPKAAVAYSDGSAIAAIVQDKGSVSGMSIIWPGHALGKTIQASMASTRASSRSGASSTEEVECDVQPPQQGHDCSSSSEMQVLDLKDLKDLGIVLKCEHGAESLPTTAAGSPYMSSVSSRSQAEHIAWSPVTPTSWMGGPVHRSSILPPLGATSQRSPFSPGLLCSAHSLDASQRTPPQSLAQHINGGLLQSGDASQRTLPLHQRVQRITSGLHAKGCDASQRGPAARSCPSGLGGGSWNAAAAAVAATRAAAVPIQTQTMNVALSTPAPASPPLSAADSAVVPQRMPAAEGTFMPPYPVSGTSVTAAAPTGEDSCRLNQTVGTGTDADSLKCWLAGIPGNFMLSGEDLAERLRVALPETYDD